EVRVDGLGGVGTQRLQLGVPGGGDVDDDGQVQRVPGAVEVVIAVAGVDPPRMAGGDDRVGERGAHEVSGVLVVGVDVVGVVRDDDRRLHADDEIADDGDTEGVDHVQGRAEDRGSGGGLTVAGLNGAGQQDGDLAAGPDGPGDDSAGP